MRTLTGDEWYAAIVYERMTIARVTTITITLPTASLVFERFDGLRYRRYIRRCRPRALIS